MYDLEDVCLIIDFDGFTIQKKFHVRELGYTSLTKNVTDSVRFNLNSCISKMTDKDWKCAMYCKFNIHGLSLRPMPREDCLAENKLKDYIRNIYNEHKNEKKIVVAFKGGHVEEDILVEMNIPYINLEDYGCPKYDLLPPVSIKDCGYHLNINNVHCPRKETLAFANWLNSNKNLI